LPLSIQNSIASSLFSDLVLVLPKFQVLTLLPLPGHHHHAGFVVHDRAVEDRFYKDILDPRLLARRMKEGEIIGSICKSRWHRLDRIHANVPATRTITPSAS